VSSSRRKSTIACMILAAGKGTRMNSAKNKVLHTLLGVPMVAYAVESARGLGASPIVTVLGQKARQVARPVRRFAIRTVAQLGGGQHRRLAAMAVRAEGLGMAGSAGGHDYLWVALRHGRGFSALVVILFLPVHMRFERTMTSFAGNPRHRHRGVRRARLCGWPSVGCAG